MKLTSLVTTLLALGSAAIAFASESGPGPAELTAALKHNQEELRKYSWKQRTQVSVDGEVKKVELDGMRYDMDGNLQKTTLSNEQDQKKVRGPIRKKMAKKKKKEAAEFAQEVKELIGTYMNPETWKKAFFADKIWRARQGSSIMVRVTDVVHTGDAMELEIDEASKKPKHFKITTATGGAPVVVNIEFASLTDGPNYAARQTIDTEFEKKKLQVMIENFDYMRQGG